jgi:FkbM family methyltransferase
MDKQEVYATLNEAYFREDCHERQLLDNLPRFLENAALFVDVGASLGQYTLTASRCMRGGRIIAVEADPIRHEELTRNAARWSGESGRRIDAVFAAVGDSAGTVSFYTTQSNVSGGLFPRPAADGPAWQELTVPSVTLDDLCGDEVPDFVKADIEGAELRMLRGARRILAHGRTAFLLELHGWNDPQDRGAESIPDFMRRHGYHAVAFFEHTLFLPLGATYLREKAAAGLRLLTGRR